MRREGGKTGKKEGRKGETEREEGEREGRGKDRLNFKSSLCFGSDSRIK